MTPSARSICLVAALVLTASMSAVAAPSVIAQSVAGATNLGLDGVGAAVMHIVKVADLSLSTDATNGLTVWITSGSMTKIGGTPVAFQVALVDDGAAPPSSSSFVTASGASCMFSTPGSAPVAKDLYIKYTPAALQDPGAYAASITINVVDN